MALKILTVDDSRTVRMIVRNAFRPYDCEVIEAMHGLEGLRQAMTNPDLVLLDITMPVMDGMEMLGRLRANTATSNIPVIMLTAEGQRRSAEEAQALGTAGYVVKPFNTATLVEEVGRVVPLRPKAPSASGKTGT